MGAVLSLQRTAGASGGSGAGPEAGGSGCLLPTGQRVTWGGAGRNSGCPRQDWGVPGKACCACLKSFPAELVRAVGAAAGHAWLGWGVRVGELFRVAKGVELEAN